MHHHPSGTVSEQRAWELDAAKAAADVYTKAIDILLPDGPQKTTILLKLRMIALIVNENITHKDGSGSPT